MSAMDNDPVTRNDLAEFKTGLKSELVSELTAVTANLFLEVRNVLLESQRNIIGDMDENFATKQDLRDGLIATEDRLTEKIRDTETSLLRSFEHYARATDAHLKILHGQTSASFIGHAALSERMSALEARMLDLKLRNRPQ